MVVGAVVSVLLPDAALLAFLPDHAMKQTTDGVLLQTSGEDEADCEEAQEVDEEALLARGRLFQVQLQTVRLPK